MLALVSIRLVLINLMSAWLLYWLADLIKMEQNSMFQKVKEC